MKSKTRVFIGSEALVNGALTEYELRRWHRRIYPDIYVEKGAVLTLEDRSVAAWLWSSRGGVIAGTAASGLHGAPWVDSNDAIELIARNSRRHAGLVVRNETLAPDEITRLAGLPVTTPARTAFDLGRHLPRNDAIARMDALMWAGRFSIEDVVLLAKRHDGVRGLRRLRAALPLVDGGAASPKETWLRLLLIDDGITAPTTQIPVYRGREVVAWLDMGWEEVKVALEYDGDHHRSDRRQYVKDIRRSAMVDDLGWRVVRVVKEDRPADVLRRVRAALAARGLLRD